VVYDGEQRRSEVDDHAVIHAKGFETRGTVRSWDNKYYTKAAVTEKPLDGKKIWLFEGLVSNGSKAAYLDDPTIALADKDGVTADLRSFDSKEIALILQPATAARVRRVYWAPPDFVPDHLLYACAAAKCKPMRLLLPANPAPAPSP